MSESILGTSIPRTRVSRSALERNIARAAREAHGSAIDLRRDACGHGARIVADAARDAGITAAIVDQDGERFGLGIATAPALPLESVFGLEERGEPVMTLAAPVLQVKTLRAGDGVSYGYRHRAERDTRVALVSGGYAQGVARAIGSRAAVLFGDDEAPIIGRVAMDVCVVDIGGLDVGPRDEARFFGAARPDLLRAWADATGWTELELAAVVGLSVPREEVA
ncbi:MAG: alanine racemase C-terminal domain-containing protein [Microbacterium gubbeenense]|uniref:alanine racemase C-terminal domain-containing protein n=1 Tax=Microbacterium gubbeenense TaxID=159896 RepID=UPI003F9C402D